MTKDKGGKMHRLYRGIILFAGIVFFAVAAFAQVSEEVSTPEYTSQVRRDSIESFLDKTEVDFFFAFLQGYDNNVHLNSARQGDHFKQIIAEPTLSYNFDDDLKGLLGYELMGLFYIDESKVNVVKNVIRLGTEYAAKDDLTFFVDYRFGDTDYINTGNDDFFDHRIEVKMKQTFPKKLYHALSYEFMFRDYAQRNTRITATKHTDANREDARNTVEYEIGKFFLKDLFKVKFQYYFNNSNERYLSFYDYDCYKATASLTHLFTEKVFGYLSFTRQFKDYRSRTLSVDEGAREWDRSYIATTGLYYALNKAVTLGCNYSYRQNWSNEPVQRYSGSTVSIDAYYKF